MTGGAVKPPRETESSQRPSPGASGSVIEDEPISESRLFRGLAGYTKEKIRRKILKAALRTSGPDTAFSSRGLYSTDPAPFA
jgi:hypothetical protein